MIHVLWSQPTAIKISQSKCPTCDKRTRFMSWFQEWYGWKSTCLSCGDAWQDGEMLPRPFMPGWRKKSIAEAKAFHEKHKEIGCSPSASETKNRS